MKTKLIALSTLALTITGCAGTGSNYQPIVDGSVGYGYSQDLKQCRRVAEQKRYLNSDTKLKAATGAILGGLIGAAGDGGDGAVAGAVAGGLIGTGEGAANVHKARKQIVIRCMQGRGHAVVG